MAIILNKTVALNNKLKIPKKCIPNFLVSSFVGGGASDTNIESVSNSQKGQ